jgi:hypothetical protein
MTFRLHERLLGLALLQLVLAVLVTVWSANPWGTDGKAIISLVGTAVTTLALAGYIEEREKRIRGY